MRRVRFEGPFGFGQSFAAWFVLLLIVFLPPGIHAQQVDSMNTIERRIQAMPETEASLLAKTRDALRKAILANDSAKIHSLAEFINYHFDSTDVIPLWFPERMLMDYWAGLYGDILDTARHTVEPVGMNNKLLPPNDRLLFDVSEHTRQDMHTLEQRIRSSKLGPESEDFLILFLHYMVGPGSADENVVTAFQDNINTQADKFLSDYKQSQYDAFIRRYIRLVYRPADWGLGMTWALGRGGLNGSVGQYFTNPFLIELAFDGTFHSYYAIFDLGVGVAASARNTFVDTKGRVWNGGLGVDEVSAVLGVGARVYNSPSFLVSPYAGIGYFGIGPSKNDQNSSNNYPSLNAAVVVVGANFDIPVSHSRHPSFSRPSYLYIRIHPSLEQTVFGDPEIRGSFWSVTVGFGGFTRLLVRDF